MNSKFLAALGIAGALMTAAPAQAHFMMAYTPETALEKAQDLDMRFVFTHPAEAGHMMNMVPAINAALSLNTAQSFSIFNSRYTTNPINMPYTTATTAASVAVKKPP